MMRVRTILVGIILVVAAFGAGHVMAARPVAEPLPLSLYFMCQGQRGTLWEVETDRTGRIDVSSSPMFRPRRIVRVADGDTFFWTRSTVVYIRQRGGTDVLTATADEDRC